MGDFGLVTALPEEQNDALYGGNPYKKHTAQVGTQLYMSPEQVCQQLCLLISRNNVVPVDKTTYVICLDSKVLQFAGILDIYCRRNIDQIMSYLEIRQNFLVAFLITYTVCCLIMNCLFLELYSFTALSWIVSD